MQLWGDSIHIWFECFSIDFLINAPFHDYPFSCFSTLKKKTSLAHYVRETLAVFRSFFFFTPFSLSTFYQLVWKYILVLLMQLWGDSIHIWFGRFSIDFHKTKPKVIAMANQE